MCPFCDTHFGKADSIDNQFKDNTNLLLKITYSVKYTLLRKYFYSFSLLQPNYSSKNNNDYEPFIKKQKKYFVFSPAISKIFSNFTPNKFIKVCMH